MTVSFTVGKLHHVVDGCLFVPNRDVADLFVLQATPICVVERALCVETRHFRSCALVRDEMLQLRSQRTVTPRSNVLGFYIVLPPLEVSDNKLLNGQTEDFFFRFALALRSQ